MKKVILMVAVVATAVLVSCSSKTCYKCVGSTGGSLDSGEWCEDVYTSEQMTGFKTACEMPEVGGTWTKK